MPKTLVVLNPISGHGAAAKLETRIVADLRKGGIDLELVRTATAGDAIRIAEQAKQAGYETIIAVGGDGTLDEVVNGILRASAGHPSGTLGIIPVGTGNDFCKMLSLPSDWSMGVERIVAGRCRWVDVGHVVGDKPAVSDGPKTRYFLNGLDTGFGALVATHAHDVPYLKGTALYLVAVLQTLVRYEVPHVRIGLDEEMLEQKSTMVVAANGRCFGGGFWIAPKAEADDGLLDVIIAQGLGRFGILSLLPKVLKGTHLGDARVRFTRTAHLTVESPDPLTVETDGEIVFLGAHHLEIKVLPKHLQIIA